MSVIVSNGNTNLSAASGFYRAEAHNLSTFSTTTLSLSSSRTIPVTFANAGNCQGLIITLDQNFAALGSTMKSVTVTLQENVATVWTDRATVTLTGAQITNNMASYIIGKWAVPFTGGTFPYAVTTAASTWRFQVSNATGTNNWSIRTSDGTNPSYITWCDNAVTFASGDTIVCKDVVTVDLTTTIKGTLSTGDTTRGVAAFICKGSTGALGSVANLVWGTGGSYTLTVDGIIAMGAHSGFRAGTLASPITFANKGKIDWIAPTVGTVSGFQALSYLDSSEDYKMSVQIYGEIPTKRSDTISTNMVAGGTFTVTIASPGVVTRNSHGYSNNMPVVLTTTGALPTGLSTGTIYYVRNAATNTFELSLTSGGASINTTGTQSGTHTVSPVLVTTTSTGWTVGDRIYIGRQNSVNANDQTIYTISQISGQNIVLTTALAGFTRIAGGQVINLERYGFQMYGYSSGNPLCNIRYPNALILSGVELLNIRFILIQTFNGNTEDDAGNFSALTTTNCFYKNGNFTPLVVNVVLNSLGATITNNHLIMAGYSAGVTINTTGNGSTLVESGVITYTGNYHGVCSAMNMPTYSNSTYSSNIFDNQNQANNYSLRLVGANIAFQNNEFWGSSDTLVISNFLYPSAMGGNIYNLCNRAIIMSGAVVGAISSLDFFGNISANFTDIDFGVVSTVTANQLIQMEFASPSGNLTIPTTNQKKLINNSFMSLTNYNLVTNDDRGYKKYGNFQRTGFGLSDTTVWNGTAFAAASAGQFGLRLTPNDGTNLLTYQDNGGSTTIGNCQTLPVQVTMRIKLNNAAYYAGTNVLPRLRVTYDGSTVVTNQATATTSAQQLSVSFTPTTTTASITIQLEMASDATGTNAYVYLGEVVVNPPPGVVIDTTRLGSFSHALPLGTTRTFPANSSVWDELKTNHTIAGSYGQSVSDTEVETKNFLTM